MAPRDFDVVLDGVDTLPHYSTIVERIRSAFEPLARRAGRSLNLIVPRTTEAPAGDLRLHFDRSSRSTGPGTSQIFGDSAGREGTVYVDEHRETRVGGGIRPMRFSTERDYTTRIQTVFEPNDVALAHHIANTAIHELGHMLLNSSTHSSVVGNALGPAVAGRTRHTLGTSQLAWQRDRTFDPTQQSQIIGNFQRGTVGVPGFNVIGGFSRSRSSAVDYATRRRIGERMLGDFRAGKDPFARVGNRLEFDSHDRRRANAYMTVGINPIVPGRDRMSGKPYAFAGDMALNAPLDPGKHWVFEPEVITLSHPSRMRSRPFGL